MSNNNGIFKSINRFRLRMLRKMTFLPQKQYLHYSYEYNTKKALNLDNPIEFNEKIQWYKIFYHPKILNQLVDKYEVRSYVKEKIGAKYLNEIYGAHDNPNDVKFDELPNQFVVKANHASGYNLIVDDKKKLNKFKARLLFTKWLNTNQYSRIGGKEWAYKDVKPKLVVEKYLQEEDQNSLIDYKFYCFNGKAKFIQVHIDRVENHKKAFYDLDFNLLPFRNDVINKSINKDIKKPSTLNEMIELAEKLADKLPFVRVDFYSLKEKVIFGEMTFYPTGGYKEFYPEKYNKIIGDYFMLPQLLNNQKEITKI